MDIILVGAVGLGGLYAIAKTEKQNKNRETMQTIGQKTKKIQNEDLNLKYNSPNDASSMYIDQERFQRVHNTTAEYKQQLANNSPYSPDDEITVETEQKRAQKLMSGEEFKTTEFTHNNMVPFFGAKIRGRGPDLNQSESILDNMAGTGSLQFENSEPGPLFRPEDNIQNPYGMQNNSDFYQSRVNPSLNISNVKPWEEIRVGPGLGKGYTADGSSGFNAGMEARDAWLPKTVNELRTVTNPKVSFGLSNHEGPAISEVKNLGNIGEVNKYRPDTYYNNSPERYFTTTGIEKGERQRGIEKLKEQNRIDTTREFSGIAGNTANMVAGKAPENYSDPLRPHVYGQQLGAPHYTEESYPATDGDYGRLGYKVLPNNRTTTRPDGELGGIGGAIGAVIAPIMDILKPSRKENVTGNARLYGYVQKSGAGGEYIYNRNQTENRVRTTHKESYVDSPYHLNIENQTNGAYLITKQQPVQVQRDTTNTDEMGPAGSTQQGIHLQDMYWAQRNNCNKIQAPASIHGNMSLLNGDINMSLNNKCLPQEREHIPSNGPFGITPSSSQIGMDQSVPQGVSYDKDRIGTDRINPDLLNAFKQNPYTQSLASF